MPGASGAEWAWDFSSSAVRGVMMALLLVSPLTVASAQERASTAKRPAAVPEPAAPSLALPDFDLVTNLESPPRPTRAKPARPGRVFDGAITRDIAVAAWRGGSMVAVYDYGVNCSMVAEPACKDLGVALVPDRSGFTEERTVADPADPKFIAKLAQRIGAVLDRLRPRPRDALAAHIDNLGLVDDLTALRLIYAAARAEYEKRKLTPLFVIKNNMRGHEALLAEGALKPGEAAYIVCENCLTKAGGLELDAGVRNARTLARPIVLIEFGKAKMGWQNATLEQTEALAQRLRAEQLVGWSYWGPDEDRYEFTRTFPGWMATEPMKSGR